MRYLIVLASLWLPCTFARADPPHDRARAALALAAARPRQAPAPPQAPPCHDDPEARWRADGWQKDAAGQWFRVVPFGTGSIGTYQPAPVYAPPVPFYRPPQAFFGGGFRGGFNCGPGG